MLEPGSYFLEIELNGLTYWASFQVKVGDFVTEHTILSNYCVEGIPLQVMIIEKKAKLLKIHKDTRKPYNISKEVE